MCELLVWRAHAHECAWPLPPYVASTLGSLIDILLTKLLLGASHNSGGGQYCHGKHVMLALRDLIEDDALRLVLMRHAMRAGQGSLGTLEQSRLHADWPVVVARATVPGGRPLTARAALVLTGSLQACASCALRAVELRGQAVGSHAAHGWDLEVLAGLLAKHYGMLRLLLALDPENVEPCAGNAKPYSEEGAARACTAGPSQFGGEDCAPPPAGADVKAAASDPLGPPPPPVWLGELLELRKERVLMQKHNQRLQTIVDGMLSPYGNLKPWVEWWSSV